LFVNLKWRYPKVLSSIYCKTGVGTSKEDIDKSLWFTCIQPVKIKLSKYAILPATGKSSCYMKPLSVTSTQINCYSEVIRNILMTSLSLEMTLPTNPLQENSSSKTFISLL